MFVAAHSLLRILFPHSRYRGNQWLWTNSEVARFQPPPLCQSISFIQSESYPNNSGYDESDYFYLNFSDG
jgi:hypothetical protein